MPNPTVGDRDRHSVTWKDENGNLVDPTTVVLTVRDPLGTKTIPAVTRDSLGVYEALVDYDTVGGPWKCRYVATGAYKGAEHYEITVDPDEVD